MEVRSSTHGTKVWNCFLLGPSFSACSAKSVPQNCKPVALVHRARQLSACSAEPALAAAKHKEARPSCRRLNLPLSAAPFLRSGTSQAVYINEQTLSQGVNCCLNDRISQLGGKFRPNTFPFQQTSAAHPFASLPPRPDPRVFSPVESRLWQDCRLSYSRSTSGIGGIHSHRAIACFNSTSMWYPK